MTTPAYTEFNATLPSGSHTGPTVIGEIVANFLALRDKLMTTGAVKDFTYSQTEGSGSYEEPQYVFLKNGAIWYRGTPTWSGGAVSSMVWEWSNDSGATYAAVMTVGATIDGSGNVTATSVGGGLLYAWVNSLRARLKALVTAYTAHAASSTAHGIGTIAAQAANNVNIDGGLIDGTAIGTASSAEGLFTRAGEQFVGYTPGAGAGVTLSWGYGGSQLVNNGTNVLTFSNVPSGRIATHFLICGNLNSTTFPAAVSWGVGGKPSIAGAAIVQMVTINGGTNVYAMVAWRAA